MLQSKMNGFLYNAACSRFLTRSLISRNVNMGYGLVKVLFGTWCNKIWLLTNNGVATFFRMLKYITKVRTIRFCSL